MGDGRPVVARNPDRGRGSDLDGTIGGAQSSCNKRMSRVSNTLVSACRPPGMYRPPSSARHPRSPAMISDPPPEASVLIVDDCDDARETLAILLEEEGYRVATAPDGERALEYLRAGARP